MANDVVKMLDRWLTPLTPIVVGAVLISNTSLIGFVPSIIHTIAGWGLVIVGVTGYFK